MNDQQASVKLSYEKTGSHLVSVKLRVYYQCQKRRFSFPLKEPVLVTMLDFERLLAVHQKTSKGRVAEEVKTLYDLLSPYLERAEQLVKQLIPFSFDAFKQQFYSNKSIGGPATCLVTLLEQKAVRLEKNEKIGNADNYRTVAHSLTRFVSSLTPKEKTVLLNGSPTLLLAQLTPDVLTSYERWMLQHGKASRKPGGPATPATLTTISIYCRTIRSIYNEAIEEGLISMSTYPFTKKGYVIPASANVKKALSKEELLSIINYQAEAGSFAQRGKDLWVFSYLSNGMNLADIIRLRWKDLSLPNQTLSFVRTKTTQTRKAKQVKITARLFDESLAIIERWGNPRKGANEYVFPFINDTMDARRQKGVIRDVIQLTNKHMSRIGNELGIQGQVNTYAARHSFATILLRSEAPVAFISQSLGHTSLKTTEDYLGSFEDEQTRKYLNNLL